jgi:phenylpropionate dioxygenase-like ring-hydroxylating dioxygenase large terminal subunit
MDASYESGFDDGPDSRALATSAVTFRYMSGPKSMSKLSGTNVVTVRNEAHLPYTAVIRVFFGKNCVKTIHASAVPVAEGRTMVMWRLYRNFAMTVPRDEGPINQALDAAFRVMMHVTLTEDKKIVEELYTDFQQGQPTTI